MTSLGKIRPLKKGQDLEELIAPINKEVVQLLEDVLERAKSGDVTSACVLYTDDGFITFQQEGIEDALSFVGQLHFLIQGMLLEDEDET